MSSPCPSACLVCEVRLRRCVNWHCSHPRRRWSDAYVNPSPTFADIPAVAQNTPPGVHPAMFCPAADKALAVCLWQSESVDAVRDYIEAITGPASHNTYFAVDDSYAIGLPGQPS